MSSSTTKIFLTFLHAIFLIVLPAVIGAFATCANHEDEVKCVERERQALIQFKVGLIDDHAELHSWDTANDCCQWEGVVCDNRTTHIVALDLSGFHFLGGKMVSPSLLELQELNHLDLSFTNFSGIEIPNFIGSLGKLRFLNLSFCEFDGIIPQSLSNLSMLQFLDLRHNYMVRSNDLDWLSSLKSLEYVDLSSINLTKANGWLQEIMKLPMLKEIHLGACLLSPALPTSQVLNISNRLSYVDLSVNDVGWGILDFLKLSVSLSHLDLSSNSLIGRIPESLRNLTNLSNLVLSFNLIEGSIPDHLGNLTSLSYLDLSINQLQGGIPSALGNSISLRHLDLSNNQLQGGILSTLGNLTSLFHLDLSNNHLHGSIPSALGNLISLFHLDLSNNQLIGSIPTALGHLISLSYLDVSNNQLQFLDQPLSSLTFFDISKNKFQGELTHFMKLIWNSTMLEYIDLSENLLFGFLPNMSRFQYLKELRLNGNYLNELIPQDNLRLPYVEFLDLSRNRFIGRVPNLSSCLSLRQLRFNDNMFNGTLTESIGNLFNLKDLNLASNNLEGVISEVHLFNLSKLETLDLSFNSNLTVRISSFWNPPFQLWFLSLASCTLGPHFPMWLQKQRGLEELDVSNANIADAIPNWFWNNTQDFLYHLNMSHNDIHGTLPDLSAKVGSLTSLDLSFNQLSGTLPKLPPIFEINFSKNRFSGSIINICNFGHVLGLRDVSNNQLSGMITTACFRNLMGMFYINLANNNLSGNIQANQSSSCSLFSLYLRNNSFTGYIPKSLGACNNLISLDLGENNFIGNIPSWVGESLPKLIVLSLKSNQLHGSLPSSLCHLSRIQVLDISMNRVSGTIPKCLNNLTMLSSKSNFSSINHQIWGAWGSNATGVQDSASVMWKGKVAEYMNTLWLLKAIDFSSNKLSGEIPHEITSLTELIALNLSRNNLTGSIPKDINQLGLLNFLDLSRNQLSGNIPSTLSQLSHLGVLDLSFNILSGKIPWDTHMDTFSASSYIGNPGLCGAPLISKPCPDEVNEKPNKGEKTEHEKMWQSKEFYISMLVGFCVAFWGVCWALFFSKKWNVTTNKMLICVEDYLYVNTLVTKRRLQSYFGNSRVT